MKAGRAFSLLTGVTVLSLIASVNEIAADAQSSWLDAAAGMVRGAARSLLQSTVASDGSLTVAPDRPAHAPAPRGVAEHRGGEDTPHQRPTDAEPYAPAGNPLWAVPLKQLSITRERPIFATGRRLPPPTPIHVAPVAIQQPVKPLEPKHPIISLLGTIIGSSDQIGVFLDSATQKVIRLRFGEDHQGWVLRLIKVREVTLVKSGEQAVVLQLSPSDETPALGGQPAAGGPPGVVTGTIPILSSTNDADEQPTGWRASRAGGK